MLNRINWNKYEVAILIEQFWNIEKNPENKEEITRNLSNILRCMGLFNGVTINDMYRNYNGIKLQLVSIGHEFFNERKGLNSSLLFKDMVKIYNTDTERFEEILKEAYSMLDGCGTMNKTDIVVSFGEWLDKKTLYPYTKSDILMSIEKASRFSVNHNLSKKSIWEINNTDDFVSLYLNLINENLYRETNPSSSKTLIDCGFNLFKEFLNQKDLNHEENGLVSFSDDNQPAYDRTEAIFIIDRFIKNRDSLNYDWNNEAQYISKVLRRRAVKFDKVIDLDYRSTESIKYRIDKIRRLLSGDTSSDCHNIFLEIIDLLQNGKNKYEMQAQMVEEQLEKLGVLCINSEENNILPAVEDISNHKVTDSNNVEKDIHDFLEEECKNNEYGTTSLYISDSTGVDLKSVEKILKNASWAKKQFGKYMFIHSNKSENIEPESLKNKESTEKDLKINEKGSNIDNNYKDIDVSCGSRKYLRDDKERFFRWLIQRKNIDENTSIKYVSAINKAESYAKKYISTECLLFSGQREVVAFTIDCLANKEYIKLLDDNQKNLFLAAYKLLFEYKNICDKADTVDNALANEHVKENNTASNIPNSRILEIVRLHYKSGINSSSKIEIIRFRKYFEKDYNIECNLSDEDLICEINKCGFSFNNKIHVIDKDVLVELKLIIEKQKKNNTLIVFFEPLYNNNIDYFIENGISSVEMLASLIKREFSWLQIKEKYFLLSHEHYTEIDAIEKELIRVWGDSVIRTFDELGDLLPLIPRDKIKFTLSKSEVFVRNSSETYTSKKCFLVSKNQIAEIRNLVFKECNSKGSINIEDISVDEIWAENYEMSESAVRDIIFSLISTDFSKNGKIITLKDNSITSKDALIEYCNIHEKVTLSELEQIMKDVSGTVRKSLLIDVASSVMVRIDNETFVTDKKVSFDCKYIDSLLDKIVSDKGISLKDVSTFASFPYCGVSWNLSVLESYCRRFSEKYKYICITSNNQNVGAIIKKNSNLDYHNIMANAIALAPINIEESEVYDYLIDEGFIMRRQYSNIKDLLKLASSIRERSK